MVLGAARVELLVHGSRSLKEKRGVVRSITQRVRNRRRQFYGAVSDGTSGAAAGSGRYPPAGPSSGL